MSQAPAAVPAERTADGHLFAVDAVSARGVARLTGELVEVLGERSESSQVFALPDGQLVAQQGSGPVWARVGDGDGTVVTDWAPVDVTLQVVGESVAPVASPVDVVLSGGGVGSLAAPVVLASVTDASSGVVTSALWPGVLPVPVLEENRATYAGVSPGLDVVVQVSASGFEQFYVAHDAVALEAAAALPLTLTSSGGRVVAVDGGGLDVVDTAGQVVASSPTPMAWDASVDELLQEGSVLSDPSPVVIPKFAQLPSVEALMAGKGVSGPEVADAGRVGEYGAPGGGQVSPNGVGAGVEPQAPVSAGRGEPGAGREPDPADPLAVGTAGVAVLEDAVQVTGEASAVVDVSGAVELGTGEDASFPVVIDPSGYVFAGFDAYIQSGTSYDTSWEPELRLGTFDGGRTVARSYIHMPLGGLEGAHVSYAEFWLTSTHSYSCQPRGWQLWGTGAPWHGMSWGNAPAFAGNNMLWSGTWTTGYGAGCPRSTIKFDVTPWINWATTSGNPSYTFGIKAANESDSLGWKKFESVETGQYVPTLLVVYNFPPANATQPTISPAGSPVHGAVWTSSKTPVISTQVWDPDGDAVTVVFETLVSGKVLSTHTVFGVPHGSAATWQLPSGALAEGATYEVRARAQDAHNAWAPGYSPSTIFGQDTTVPAAPVITSPNGNGVTGFPADGTWHHDAGVTGKFALTLPGADASVTEYWTDAGKMPTGQFKTPTTTGAPVTVPHTAPTVGKHTVWAVAVDRAGNRSAPGKYTYLVGRAGLVSPQVDARVVRRARLEVGWNAGEFEAPFNYVRYEWRRGPDAAQVFPVDPGVLTTSAGDPLTWSGGWATAPQLHGYANWDALMSVGADGGPAQVRAVVAKDATGTGAATTQWVSITVDPDAHGAATGQVGPGSVNLLTGDYAMSVTDVSEFGMDLVRTTSSRDTDSGFQVQEELAAPGANGKFENVVGAQGAFGGYASASVDTSRFHSGSSSIKVTPAGKGTANTYASLGGDFGGMRLGLRAGQSYRLSTWVYVPASTGLTPAASGGNRMSLLWKNAAGVYESVTGPAPSKVDTWQKVTVDATIPAGATEAFVRVNSGQTDPGKPVYFDDFSVRALWAPFGLAWLSGSMDSAAGTAYTKVATPEDGLVTVGLTGGGKVTFTRGGSNTWFPEAGAEDLKLTHPDPATWILTEIDGTTTTFVRQNAGGDWPVVSSAPPVAAGQSRHVYTPVGGVQRLNRIIAPIEPGIDGWIDSTSGNLQACTSLTPARGCEVIDIDYAATTTATKDTPGVVAGQVAQAAVWIWDEAKAAMVKTPIAAYRYNAAGQLVQVWDPRLEPRMVTTYTYDAEGRLTGVTPPGEVPYTFTYGKAGATLTGAGDLVDNSAGRVLTVNRASLEPGSKDTLGSLNTTTIVYNVPLTRDKGGPYTLQGAALGTWAQSDGPTDATAIYGPEDDPGLNTARAEKPGKDGYKPAVVHYLNSAGREVNTAAPMGKDTPAEGFITTTEYDKHGNTVRTLDATNRLLALGALPGADKALTELGLAGRRSAELSVLLDSRSTYDWQGLDLLTTTGPVQRLAVDNNPNDVRLLRPRTVNVYDQGKPDGAEYHLLTTETTGSIDPFTTNSATPENDVLIDPIVTVNDYNPINGAPPTGPTSGWTHKQATRITVDAGQPSALASSVLYDAHGRVLESRKPGSNGADTGTTRTVYYTAGGSGDCAGRPEWVGQPCVVSVGGPVTGHDGSRMSGSLSVKRTEAYNGFGSPTVVSESATGPVEGVMSTITRTSRTAYDAADRVVSVELSASGAGAGVPVSRVLTAYDPVSGDVVKNTAVDASGNETGVILKEYDLLGRVMKYTDSHGNWTATRYDRYDKPVAVTDSIGATRSYTYDRRAEPRGFVTKLTDSVGGDVVPTWGPDGQLESQLLPGGVRLDVGYDAARVPVRRTYTRDSDGTVLASDSVVENHRGQWIRHTSTTGDRSYSYDRLGRLTSASDVNYGTSVCTSREYGFDARSNRTSMTTSVGSAGVGSGTVPCGESQVTGQAAYTYDSADRLVTSSGLGGDGWTYDPLGRVTAMPAGDGTVATTGFHVNDLVAVQEVPGVKRTTWTLDPLMRFDTQHDEAWVEGAWASSVDKITAYDGDGDEPAWIVEDASNLGDVTRYVESAEGDAAMSTSKSGDRVLFLIDLHGDITATVPIADGAVEGDWAKLAFSNFDEFGNPQPLVGGGTSNAPPGATGRYGWLGAAQRSADTPAGVILMGVRLYHQAIGRFLSVDPVAGGSVTAYDYCNGDPVNCTDLDGLWPKINWKKSLNIVAKVGEVASNIPGPIGSAAAGVSAVAYAANGNKGKALEMGVTAAAALIPGGAAAAKVGFKGAAVAAKVGNRARSVVKAARAGCKNSFVPGTLVVMADGSSQPIESLQAGDDVLATDPATGETTSENVITPITGYGVRHLIAVSIQGVAEPIIATANHPIWTTQTGWTHAADLQPGQTTTDPLGKTTTITGVNDLGWTQQQTVHNLHITGPHTYYIQTTPHDTPTLTHNCPAAAPVGRLTEGQARTIANELGYTRVRGTPSKANVYENRKAGAGMPKFISRDIDVHGPGEFKGASTAESLRLKSTRMGTYAVVRESVRGRSIARLVRVRD